MDIQDGRNFFDEEEVFDQYIKHREWEDSLNRTVEKPIILSLLNDFLSGSVIDLGCGYGDLVNSLLSRGIEKYTGIDSSSKMIQLSESNFNDPRVEFIKSDIQVMNYNYDTYNLVIARLIFHYIDKLDELLVNISSSMKASGVLLLSVEHPVITSTIERYDSTIRKTSWVVDNYFDMGTREQSWLGGRVIKYHRTVEEYWRIITKAGFTITDLKEGIPDQVLFSNSLEFERRLRLPRFLIIKAVKSS